MEIRDGVEGSGNHSGNNGITGDGYRRGNVGDSSGGNGFERAGGAIGGAMDILDFGGGGKAAANESLGEYEDDEGEVSNAYDMIPESSIHAMHPITRAQTTVLIHTEGDRWRSLTDTRCTVESSFSLS